MYRDYTNPYSWLRAAEHLHEQAVGRYGRRSGSSILTKIDPLGVILEQKVLIDRSVFMLAGLPSRTRRKRFLYVKIRRGSRMRGLQRTSIRPQQEHRSAVYLAQMGFIQAEDSPRRADAPERGFQRSRFAVTAQVEESVVVAKHVPQCAVVS
jgi:hypothetical protein